MNHPKIILSSAGGTFLVVAFLFSHLPSEIVPKEDRNLMGVYLPRIPGKDINALEPFAAQVEDTLKNMPELKGYLTFMGDWGASICVSLKNQEDRKLSAASLVDRIRPQMQSLPSVEAYLWSWDSGLPGLDDALSGSELTLSVSTIGSL